jgi:hypothetical protein
LSSYTINPFTFCSYPNGLPGAITIHTLTINQAINNGGGMILTGVNGTTTTTMFKPVAEPLESMVVDTGESEPQ